MAISYLLCVFVMSIDFFKWCSKSSQLSLLGRSQCISGGTYAKPSKINRMGWYFCRLPCWFFFFLEIWQITLYLDFLENVIKAALTKIMESNGACIAQEIVFQHDGPPPHYLRIMRDCFNERSPGPPSPDLSRVDRISWVHMKKNVFCSPLDTIDDLLVRFVNIGREVTPQMHYNVLDAFENNHIYFINKF